MKKVYEIPEITVIDIADTVMDRIDDWDSPPEI